MSDEHETPTRRPLTDAARQAILAEVPGIEAALGRIRAVLDLAEQECSGCHLRVKRAIRDAQLAENLGSIRHKLRRWEDEAGGRKVGT